MQTPHPKELGPIQLTQEQREQLKRATGGDGETAELRVEELEERIMPRIATNHNETLLVDL
jgi:hypothetical protein